MPGIVGLVTRMPRQRAERQLRRMVETLRHESFYETGTWIDEPIGVYVGWSARRGPFSDRMPLRNERGDVMLVFSGEEFAEPGISRRLKERGHDLALDGPDYLVHLCEDDPTFPAGLNGRFHGLVGRPDSGRGDAVQRPIRTAPPLLPRSEGRRVLRRRSQGDPRRASRTAHHRSAGARRVRVVSVRAGEPDAVQRAPRASRRARGGRCATEPSSGRPRTFAPRSGSSSPSSTAELLSRAARRRRAHAAALLRRPRANRHLADRRVRYAHDHGAARRAAAALPCYTFAGMFRESHDVRVAREVAEACGLSHHIIRVGEAFLARFPTYAERTVYLTRRLRRREPRTRPVRQRDRHGRSRRSG